MANLLDLVLVHAHDTAAHSHLQEEVAAHIEVVRASIGGGKRGLVAQAEAVVRTNPAEAFMFAGNGSARLTVGKRSWDAGHFETLSIKDLRDRARHPRGRKAAARTRLWVFDGTSPATDIGSLQATSGRDTVFQVASQFNCLESPDSYVTPEAEYFDDPTQGPRASISAFPATLLRHYRAPGADGRRYVQVTDGPQIDLLADACGQNVSRNGYFTGDGLSAPENIVKALEDNLESIRVGVHSGVQVVLGYNWDGAVMEADPCRIAQVFTSTVAGGGYGGEARLGAKAFHNACRQLLRAAYLGTLLAAVSLRRKRVVLTLIGGGVFGNPIETIWEAIHWAVLQAGPYLAQDLDVIVNGYNLSQQIDVDKAVLPVVRAWNGAVFSFDDRALVSVRR